MDRHLDFTSLALSLKTSKNKKPTQAILQIPSGAALKMTPTTRRMRRKYLTVWSSTAMVRNLFGIRGPNRRVIGLKYPAHSIPVKRSPYGRGLWTNFKYSIWQPARL